MAKLWSKLFQIGRPLWSAMAALISPESAVFWELLIQNLVAKPELSQIGRSLWSAIAALISPEYAVF